MTRLSRREALRATARAFAQLVAVAYAGSILASCDRKPSGSVTLYTSIDQPIAARVVAAFEQQTGIKVRLVTDTEATKSVGLAERLRAEKKSPIADVFWANEVFHTVNLADEGLFASLPNLPVLAEIRPEFKDEQQRWAGVGLRARVLAIHEQAGPVGGSIEDLADPRFKGKIALARPLAGTTGGHVAALYSLWGEAKADDFFRRLRDNGALMLGGNGPVAESVGSGNILVGLTDNDDVYNAQRARGELWQVLPDQGDGQIGTLAIPTVVALVKRDATENAEPAKQLVAFLLSASTERLLIDENFCAFSVRESADAIRVMPVKFADAARLMATAPKRATDLLEGRAK